MQLAIIVAVSRNGVIGADGTLPWHLKSDLRRFKSLTMGHAIVMGRRTHESIGRTLPGRQNIVITSRPRTAFEAEGLVLADSLDQALELAKSETVFVIGGAQLYAEAFPRADLVYLTLVETVTDGDTHFPLERLENWEMQSDEFHEAGVGDDFDCRFRRYATNE